MIDKNKVILYLVTRTLLQGHILNTSSPKTGYSRIFVIFKIRQDQKSHPSAWRRNFDNFHEPQP